MHPILIHDQSIALVDAVAVGDLNSVVLRSVRDFIHCYLNLRLCVIIDVTVLAIICNRQHVDARNVNKRMINRGRGIKHRCCLNVHVCFYCI